MVSSLQQQLNKLASGHRHETRIRKVASFLFTDEVAQEVSTEQCFKIGVRGLKGLAQLDSRFNHFFGTLYDEAGLETDRLTMSPGDAEAIDNEMELFFWLLSPYFMQSCAHEALEYLIRQYEPHLVLPESLLRVVLPYHDHLYFPRLVQLIPLRGTRWEFLTRIQKEGAPVPRTVFVRTILDDPSILAAICEWTVAACERETLHPAMLNLFNGVIVEIIHTLQTAGKAVDDRLVTAIMPVAEHLVSKGTTLDGQAAGHTAIATLFATTPMSQALCMATFLKLIPLLTESSGSRPVTPPLQVIKVLAIVASQLTNPSFSRTQMTKFVNFRWESLSAELGQLQHSVEGAMFLSLLFKALVTEAVASSGRRMGNLKSLIETMALTEKVGQTMALHCLNHIVEGKQTLVITEILVILERHCAKGFDLAIKHALQTFNSSAKDAVYNWLKEGFKGTRHQPVTSNEGQFSLTVGCMHHESNVRKLAAEELIGVLKKAGNNDLSKLLLHMLDIEEDANVLNAILSEKSLCDLVDYNSLVSVLSGLARRHTYPKPTKVSPAVASTLVAAVAKSSTDYSALVLFTCMLQAAMFHSNRSNIKTVGAAKEALASTKSHLHKFGESLETSPSTIAPYTKQVHSLLMKVDAAAWYAKHLAACSKKALALRNKKHASADELLILEDEITHCLLVLSQDTATSPLELFCHCREHIEAVFTQVAFSSAVAGNAEASYFMDMACAPSTPPHERIKYSYLMFLSSLTSTEHIESLTDELSSKLSTDCFHLMLMAGNDEKVTAYSQTLSVSFLKRPSPQAVTVLAGLWTLSAVPSTVIDASLKAALALVSSKAKVDKSQLITSLLCLLNERHTDAAVVSSATELVSSLAKAVTGDMKEFLTKLQSGMMNLQSETITNIMPHILTSSAVTSELCNCALLMHLGGIGSVLNEVVDITKLRGLISCLKGVVNNEVSLDYDTGLLCAAAVGAFRAVWDLPESSWKKLPDRSLIHEVMCKCLEQVTPIKVTGKVSNKWAHNTEAAPVGTFMSLPDLMGSVLIDHGKMVSGFATMFNVYNDGEKAQFINALLALVSSGHAAGRQILSVCGPVLGSFIRNHAAVVASSWSKELTSTAPLSIPQAEAVVEEDSSEEASAKPSKRKRGAKDDIKAKRSKDDELNNSDLIRVAEALALLHPGHGTPYEGQDPVAVGSLAWKCLRVESCKARNNRSEYLITLLVSILANCANEVAAAAKESDEPTNADTLIPNVTAADRRHAALQPTNGVFMVNLEEFVSVLTSTSSATRKEGLKVYRALMEVDAPSVYSSCLHFVVSAVGTNDVDDLLEEMLTSLIPGMLKSKEANHLVTLIHVILYSYATRRAQNERALDGCHSLLSRCNVHYQLVALNKLLQLTVSDSEASPEEEKLLQTLTERHMSLLTPDQITLRVVLFALRHVVSDTFIEAVLDEEEVDDDEPEYFESFSNLFMCLLKMYKENVPEGADDSEDEEKEESEEAKGEKDDASSALSDDEGSSTAVEEDLYDLRISLIQRIKQLLVACIDVMPITVFVAAIQELLLEGSMELRALGLKLFNSKLDAFGDRMSDKEVQSFITMLPELKESIDAAITQGTEKETGSQDDEGVDAIGIQSSLWTLEILSRYLAPYHPRSFMHFLPSLSALVTQYTPCIQRSEAPGMAVTASAVLTFGHICHAIEEISLEHLPVEIPAVLKVCHESTAVASKSILGTPKPSLKLLIQSCCSAFAKILSSIARYMSPYFNDLIRLATSPGAVAVAPEHTEKLMASLIKNAEARLLFPAVTEALTKLPSDAASHAMLWGAVGEIITETPLNEVLARMEVMMKLMTASIRSYTEDGLAQLPVLKAMGDAVTALAMKLDLKRLMKCLSAIESPVFAYDRENPALSDQRQLVAFCIIIGRLQLALTSLFCPVFKMFLPQLCEYVDTIRGYKKPALMAVTATVLSLQVMKTCVMDDSDMVLAKNSELSMLMMTTVINQLGNRVELDKELVLDDELLEATGYSGICEMVVRPLLIKLCTDVHDRQLWSKVQKQVLQVFKMSSDPVVRYTVLDTLMALYVGLGQEFAAAVVAELLQTLSEALDDDDPSVSKLSVEMVKVCSQLTGEDIASYMK
eukprot:TRINITY_DN1010_c0_g1_i1.p1 TRINITY_DN1010_c0_g1~~TRINITY_DN1010_c0_g1_i1.p1  ORF type:complete len:2114 (+),score=777.18 TRINITY_DN1010_c0_g1_i1:57-6398(+)